MIISYLWIIFRWIIFISPIYRLYVYLVCIDNFEFVQFITIIGITIALLTEFIVQLLFPPVFKLEFQVQKPIIMNFEQQIRMNINQNINIQTKKLDKYSENYYIHLYVQIQLNYVFHLIFIIIIISYPNNCLFLYNNISRITRWRFYFSPFFFKSIYHLVFI